MPRRRPSLLDLVRCQLSIESLVLLAMALVAGGAVWYVRQTERQWAEAERIGASPPAAAAGDSTSVPGSAGEDPLKQGDAPGEQPGFEVLPDATPPSDPATPPALASRKISDAVLSASLPQDARERALRAAVRIANPVEQVEGTGSIIAAEGQQAYILTAWHVVEGAKSVLVTIYGGSAAASGDPLQVSGLVLAGDPGSDLALVSVSAGVSADGFLRVGSAVQRPPSGGVPGWSVGCGDKVPVCSAVHIAGQKRVRRHAGGAVVDVWEVEPASLEGHSGGALIDASGRLVGVASGNSEGKAYFTDSSEIWRFLLREGFGWLRQP